MRQIPAGIVVHQPDTEVLERLLSQVASGGRRLFIFVNGPLDAQSDSLLERLTSARVIRSRENIGLGAGLNVIAEAAIAESFSHVLLLDQDSEPSVDLAEQLLARWTAETAKGARLAVVAPLLVPPAQGHYRPIRYSWRSGAGQGPLLPVHFAPTSGSLVCLSAYTVIGPFREDFFIGGIDVEWGFRAWSRGYGSVIARDLRMVHRWGEAASPDAARTPQIMRHSGLRKYYYIRHAVYSLRLPFIPLSWRLRYALGLCSQIGYLAVHGRGMRRTSAVVFAALRDGATGRLGPVPPSLSKDILQ
jgi:rhamnosyltransferase